MNEQRVKCNFECVDLCNAIACKQLILISNSFWSYKLISQIMFCVKVKVTKEISKEQKYPFNQHVLALMHFVYMYYHFML